MKRVKHILVFLILTLTVSCDEWMELIPPQGLIRQEFWNSKEDVEAVVMGAYETFANMDEQLFKYGELRGDMVTGDYSLGDAERKIQEGNIYPDNWLCNWENFYTVINYCNEVIHNAPEVQQRDNTFTDYQLKGYLAEAYFLRSLSYFYLVRIYKDVPLVLEPTENDDSKFYLAKTDGEEVLEHIMADLHDARPFATNNGYPTISENKGRATKGAFDALMADISLWRFDYESVIQYTQRIQANKDYQLMPQGQWFAMFYPGNSLESIFEFQFNDYMNQKNSMYGITRRDGHNFDPSQQAIEMFGKEFGEEQNKETVRGEDASIKKYGENDFIIWKYVGLTNDGETERPSSIQNSANWIVYRLADILLMKAEALSQLGRYDEAKQILIDIRDRAGVSSGFNIANTPTAFEDFIMEERARELAFEGKRWFDLMRMGRRNDFARKHNLIEIIVKNVPSTQKRILSIKLANPLGWYLPIYESEIERNKNLVQNPYYNY